MIEMLLAGFAQILEPVNFLYLLTGVTCGLILGSIPGLTATMGIALVIPMTYYMTPMQSFTIIMGAFNGGVFGGSISAILIGTPGTPSAGATVADGFKMALAGKAGKAIKLALFSSVTGCLLSCVALLLVAEPVSKYALRFGPAEYAMLMLLSLTIIGSASGDSIKKGMIGGALGLLFGTVGMDIFVSTPRYIFGMSYLTGGIDLIVMLIGVLAFSEILMQLEGIARGKTTSHLPPPAHKADNQLSCREFFGHWRTILRSWALGAGIGALPGLGATLAAYVGYSVAQRSSKEPEKFGTGIPEGIIAPETANNAVCGSNLIPLLSLGVPGDAVAAMLIGAFMIQGLTPGPLVFREAPHVVFGLYAGLMTSNLLLIVLTYAFLKAFVKFAQMPTTIIFPVIISFCFIGIFSIHQAPEDLWIFLFFACIGYVLSKFGYPPSAMLIGFILSPLFEENFRRALTLSEGNYAVFYSSYICIACWLLTLYSIFVVLRSRRRRIII